MGQLSGLLYKNLKIQSKNKCGVICQLLTPMICLLIVFGLQKLVNSLNLDPKPDNLGSLMSFGQDSSMRPLLKGVPPTMGAEVLQNLQRIIKKLKAAEVHIEDEQVIPGESEPYKLVQAHKVVDDVKVPFNLVAPLNMPISNPQLQELFKDRFIIASCYKMLKFGVRDDPSAADYLRNTLKIDQNDSDLRRTNCSFKKQHVKHTIRVPNVTFQNDLKTEEDINAAMLDDEFEKMEKFDLFKINVEPQPTDGFMIFDEASPDKIRGTFSSNNIQFFAYHHSNFMNMAHTAEDLTVYMNTETHLTIIDILSNSILMNSQPNSNLYETARNKRKLASLFQNMFSNFSEENLQTWIESEDTVEDSNEGESWFGRAAGKIRQIVSLSLTFPDRDYNKIILTNMFQLLNVIFYPFAIGLGLPIILNALAMEKEERIHDLLKINGMSMFKYYLANILFWFLFLSIITVIFFVGGFLMLDDGFFHLNSPFDLAVFAVGWNLAQIVFAFFLLTMVNSAGSGSALGYVFTSIGTLWAVNVVTFIYPFPARMPYAFNLIPQMNFCRLIYFFLVKGSSKVKDSEESEFTILILFLYMNILIYSCLTFIVSRKKFWLRLMARFKKKKQPETQSIKSSKSKTKEELEEILRSYSRLSDESSDEDDRYTKCLDIFEEYSNINPELFKMMHHSALREKRQIHELVESWEKDPQNQKKLEDYAVLVKSLEKTYENGKRALANLNLKIKKGEIYGLLGPNGAGKTTLISIITSFLSKTEGQVFVKGLDMDEHQIPNTLALCPQFNIQWPDLTVREHLYIFGMLRETPLKDLRANVDKIIEEVDLLDKKDSPASTLSGGMRRRLSIAIALIGNTDLIFLDEPTTGLDPKRRRELWEIIRRIKTNKTFVISTHLMEEAEFLCDKIGVVNKGNLRATGTANFLKTELVDYYLVELTIKEGTGGWTSERKAKIQTELKGKVVYEFGDLLKVKIKKRKIKIYIRLFEAIERCGDFIKSWSFKSGSLEDAFAVIEQRYVD